MHTRLHLRPSPCLMQKLDMPASRGSYWQSFFDVQRFHTYLYGRHFQIVTDHKPLVMIMQKPLTKAPPRLQRMLLKLQGYHFNLEYKPSKEMVLADTLSGLTSKLNNSTIDLDTRVHTVRFTKERLDIVREETKKDQSLITMTSTIINGWPDSVKDVPEEIRSHWRWPHLQRRESHYSKQPETDHPRSDSLCPPGSQEDQAESQRLSLLEPDQPRHRKTGQKLSHLPGTPAIPAKRNPETT